MKKKLIGMLACIVLLGGLIGAYYALDHRNSAAAEAAEDEKPDKATPLIEKTEQELQSAVFETGGKKLTLLPTVQKAETEGGEDKIAWVIEGYEDIGMNATRLSDMARSVYQLSSVETVLDSVEDLAEYGLEPPVATAIGTYTDGSQKKLRVGYKTPAKDYYYAMVEGDPALYLIYTTVGDRVIYSLDDVVDKTVPAIDGNTLTYIYINEKGRAEVEFDFDGTEEEKKTDLEQYGGVMLTMRKPFAGRQLYSSNFMSNIMEKMGTITLGELVEERAGQLATYGLDDPELELWLQDVENDLHLLVGNDAGDGNVYVKFNDRPQVFTAAKSAFNVFYNIDVFKFIDRFVALVNIETCERFEIAGRGETVNVVLNHDVIPPEDEDGKEEKIVRPTLNGQEVQEKAFKSSFYQQVIGLSFDTEIPAYEPSGEPEVTITYYLNDGTPPLVSKYYNYPENSNFYAVQQGDEPVQFVVNKHSMDMMYQSMDDLLAGKLDE